MSQCEGKAWIQIKIRIETKCYPDPDTEPQRRYFSRKMEYIGEAHIFCCRPVVLLLIPSPVNFISQTVLAAQREERLKDRGKGDAVMRRGVWSEIRRQQAGGLQKGVVYLG